MQSDRRQRSVADAAIPVIFEARPAHVSCEERHALRRFDSRQPDECQTARIQRAIVRRDTNFYNLLRFEAIEHYELREPSSLTFPSVRVVVLDPPFSFSSRQVPQFPSFQLLLQQTPRSPAT